MSEESEDTVETASRPTSKPEKIGAEKLKILESIEVDISIEVGRTEMKNWATRSAVNTTSRQRLIRNHGSA